MTARQGAKERAAIEAIAAHAWTAVEHPRAVFDKPTQSWISDA